MTGAHRAALLAGVAIGVAVYFVATILTSPIPPATHVASRDVVTLVLIAALVSLVFPLTRGFGLGFFGALLVVSVPGERYLNRVWWSTIDNYTAWFVGPIRARARASSAERDWLASRRGRPMDIDAGTFAAREHLIPCVIRAIEARGDGRLPTAEQVTARGVCENFRARAVSSNEGFPGRYTPGDDGWRWSLASSERPSRAGGPGFVLTLVPDRKLGMPGPVIEVDGQGMAVVRETAGAPARVATTPVPLLRRVRECLLRNADSSRGPVKWEWLPTFTGAFRGCRDLLVEQDGSIPARGGVLIRVQQRLPEGGERMWSDAAAVGYRAVDAGRFELHASSRGRRFLLSPDNTVHVTTDDRDATINDPSPAPCEIDPAQPCG